jgi:hypothetical protein
VIVAAPAGIIADASSSAVRQETLFAGRMDLPYAIRLPAPRCAYGTLS